VLNRIQKDTRRNPPALFSLSQFIPRRNSLVSGTMDTLSIYRRDTGHTKAAGAAPHLPSHKFFLPIFGNTYNV